MRKNFSLHWVFLAILVFALFALPLEAQEETQPEAGEEPRGFFSKISWFVQGSVFFFPEDNGMYSDPMKILPSLGGGASYPLTKIFRLELTLDLYSTHYGYSAVLNRAVPDAIENRTARVIGFHLGLHAAAYFNVTPFMTVRAYGGPTADLRAVFIAEDLDEGLDDIKAIRKDVDAVRQYFWSKGRWFMPVIGTGVDFTLNPRFKLGIDMRIWAPMYRLWSGEDLPAIEGWRFGPGVRLTIR